MFKDGQLATQCISNERISNTKHETTFDWISIKGTHTEEMTEMSHTRKGKIQKRDDIVEEHRHRKSKKRQ